MWNTFLCCLTFKQINNKKNKATVTISILGIFSLISTLVVISRPVQAGLVCPCELSLGDAANGAVFLLGNGGKIDLTNPKTTISGNVGLGPGGIQNFADGHITGVYAVDPSANDSHSNNVRIDGGKTIYSLVNAANSARKVAAYAATLSPTITVNPNISGSTTIIGKGGLNVVKLTSINLTGANQYLTLKGTPSDYFIINVSGSIKLTHSSGGITKSGGIPPSHILFNLLSSSGDGLKVSGNADLVGTYLAPNSSITLSPGQLWGEIISGKNIALTSGAYIDQQSFWVPPCDPLTNSAKKRIRGWTIH